MNLTESHASANAGHFRPLRLLTRPGSVFDPSPHAAFAIYYEVEIRLYDLIWRCLAPHLGGRLPAGSFASICGTFIGGPHPDTGRHFTIVEPQVGGWGALGDGATATARSSAASTATRSTARPRSPRPATGSTSTASRSNDAPGGEGEHRGGKGHRRRVPRALERLLLHLRLHAERPQAVAAGGRSRRLAQLRRGDPRRRLGRGVRGRHGACRSNEGDVIRIHTGSGGGYGDPRRRPRELVQDDLLNGYVNPVVAREVYACGPEGGAEAPPSVSALSR